MKILSKLTALCCVLSIPIILLAPIKLNAQESMRANLYVVDGNGVTLMDGNMTNYSDLFSNAVDINDAWKMSNPGVNFGILREGYNLVVERRTTIMGADTTFFRMWNMPQYHYRIRFVLKNLNHPGIKAVLKDSYLNSEVTISLNDTSYYDFAVDGNTASADQMRFQVVFGSSLFAPVDVNFTGIQVQRQGKEVMVSWDVANEVSMASYSVERSADGRNFQNIHDLTALNTQVFKTYSYMDPGATTSDNFYRIKGLSINGRIQYSPIAKINQLANEQDIVVYPNPVQNRSVQLLFNNQVAGKYNIELVAATGTRFQLSGIQLNAGHSTQVINLPQTIASGVYRLLITGADNKTVVRTIQVL